jgi:CubicO group peptidase (beta-lactamase class C family)
VLTIGFLLSAGLWAFASRDVAQLGSIVCNGLSGVVVAGFVFWKYFQCRGNKARDIAGSILLLVLLSKSATSVYSQNTDLNFPLATPESQGVSKESIRQITDEAQAYITNGTVIGSELLIVKNRKTILHEVYGYRDRENEKPMVRNSIFNIRSMTKPFTGIAMQILAAEGKLSLKDSVAKYLPGFANDKSRNITIEQILQHRGGLPLSILSQSVDEFPNLQDQAKAIGEKGPEFPPGEKFWYSDAGSDAAAAIVEAVTGKPIDRFVTERILFPLAMKDSLYLHKENAVAGRDPRMDRVCSLYFGRQGNWTRFWSADEEPFYPFAWGSQSLYSTPADYALFLSQLGE